MRHDLTILQWTRTLHCSYSSWFPLEESSNIIILYKFHGPTKPSNSLIPEAASDMARFPESKFSLSLYRLDRITWMFSMSMNTMATTEEPPRKLIRDHRRVQIYKLGRTIVNANTHDYLRSLDLTFSKPFPCIAFAFAFIFGRASAIRCIRMK